jgi:hypothetical protein
MLEKKSRPSFDQMKYMMAVIHVNADGEQTMLFLDRYKVEVVPLFAVL